MDFIFSTLASAVEVADQTNDFQLSLSYGHVDERHYILVKTSNDDGVVFKEPKISGDANPASITLPTFEETEVVITAVKYVHVHALYVFENYLLVLLVYAYV